MLITDKLLLSYLRCDRRGFLDVWGDFNQLDPPSDFLLKLIRDSFTHQQAVLAQYNVIQPQYPKGDWPAGHEATLALMQAGVDYIYRGVLFLDETATPDAVAPPSLLSRPHLLIKQTGQSQFGEWMYTPADIWLGKRPKLDYQTIGAFHALVLAQIQGVMPETTWLLLREKKPYAINLTLRLPQVETALREYLDILQVKHEPEVFIARQKCSLCRWYSRCYELAHAQKHLSLLPGVTPSRYTKLKRLNLTTVESLAEISPELLAEHSEFGDGVGFQLVQQAQSTQQNRALLRRPVVEAATWANSPENHQNFPTLSAPVELYFDIEAEPELNLDYLHGVLVVDRRSNTEIFHAFLAEHPADEGLIWQKFLDFVWSYPIAPIFHFCDYEVQTFKRLAKLYQTPPYLWQPVLKRFVDIHKQVTQTVTMPVESYALKPIARWLGFEWRDAKANGAQCVCWYDEWLKTGDQSLLEAIVRYNEDDCRATHRVKDWLTQFVQMV